MADDNENNAPAVDSGAAPVSALSQAVSKDKKKKKRKKKVSKKKRAFEKLEKAAEKILENSQECNEILTNVSYWLEEKQKLAYKLFHQQCMLSLEHELFKKTVKVKKKKKKGKKSGKSDSEPDAEPEPEPDEQEPEDGENKTDDGLNNPDAESLVINTLSTIDFKINYEDFKLVCKDLGIPCTDNQLHAICKLLDAEKKKKIDFRKFTPKFLTSHIDRKYADGLKKIVGTELEKFSKNVTFTKVLNKNFADKYPLYVKLDLKLVTFANEKDYMGHLKDIIISIHETIYSLIQIIKEKTDIASTLIQVYKDTGKAKSSILDEDKTLEYYGYAGVSYNDALKSNEKILLYFDLSTLNNNDPILNCDYYFSNYKSSYKK